jgi:hypothetical protein
VSYTQPVWSGSRPPLGHGGGLRATPHLFGGGSRPPPTSEVWEDITFEFIDGLPMSAGNNSILVIVDHFTKYPQFFFALSHPYLAKKNAEEFVTGIIKLYDVPWSIVNDRDIIFISSFWREFFKLQGTELKTSSSYHPQNNGQIEVINHCLKNTSDASTTNILNNGRILV